MFPWRLLKHTCLYLLGGFPPMTDGCHFFWIRRQSLIQGDVSSGFLLVAYLCPIDRYRYCTIPTVNFAKSNVVNTFTCYNAGFFLYKSWRRKGICKFEIFINVLVSWFRFNWIYLNVIGNILIISLRGPSLYVKIWRLQTSDSDV